MRINFEKNFAHCEVGAIISSHVPVHVMRARFNYAFIDSNDKTPFWMWVPGSMIRWY
jgi:hypothetical protein